MNWPENLPPIRIIREGSRKPKPLPSPTKPVDAVSLFVQGRWWCEPCRVQWAGSWPVPDVAPHASVGEEWAPVHDCGTVMIRTSGDERADAH